MAFFKRLGGLFRSRRLEQELDEEQLSHLAMRTEEFVAAGVSPEEARLRALRAFGNPTLLREETRDADLLRWLETLVQDLRYGLRQLGRNPGFTAVALVTLALGIGANAALFSVIDAVLLRPLPFREPDRLVAIESHDAQSSAVGGGGDVSYPVFLDWRSQAHSFESMSVSNTTNFTYTGGREAESLSGAVVSANLFSSLGITPVLGRTFIPEEDKPGEHGLPLILSYSLWQSHFGSDPNVIGRAITLDDQKYNVIGVMPASFQFPVQNEPILLYTSMANDLIGKDPMAGQRGVSYLSGIGRLKPGVSMRQAQAELNVIQDAINRQYPENHPKKIALVSEQQEITGAVRPALLVLFAAVGLLLLIACVNVANLLLARATVRQKEITIRAALGARRSTVIRQLLTESVLLAVVAGGLGVLLAMWGIRALVKMAPPGLARVSEIGLDYRVLIFSIAVALLTGILFGLVPAFQVTRTDLTASLNEGARGGSGGAAHSRIRSLLVVAEVAIALVLLIGSGLLMQSFMRLKRVDPGFRPDHVLTFRVTVEGKRHAKAARAEFVRELLAKVRQEPGVTSASAVFGLPLSDDHVSTSTEVEGRVIPKSERPRVSFELVESNYFQTLGIPLLRGRAFTPQDEQGGPALAIVNEALVKKLFPGEDPIGRRIAPQISFGDTDEAPLRQIIGVVGDVRSRAMDKPDTPAAYAPQTATDFVGVMTIVVRTQMDPEWLAPTVRNLVASMDKDMPVRQIKTLDEYVDASIAQQRFNALLLGLFASLAFALTAIGLYGVISYSVAQRTREMGIRMALGASRGSILRMVVKHGALLVVIGAAAGLSGALALTRLIKSLLFNIAANDPPTYGGVLLLLLGVALLASYIPALRATRVDPMVALRYE